jgi:UDP-GlcNAc:undecaprenyl-phosphate/decaprenyl-phosphate GlcNAc-1-phosphate transferase
MTSPVLIPLLSSFTASLLAVAVIRSLCVRTSLVDRRHQRSGAPGYRPVPRLGGIGIAVGLVAGVLAVAMTGRPVGPAMLILALTAPVFAIGVLDDLRGVSGTLKLGVLIAAALACVASGLRVEVLFGYRLPEGASLVVTVIWLVGLPTGFNLIDGLDGLAAGIAVLAGAALLVVGAACGDPSTALLAAAVIGATTGFWMLNRHPARIFMGDGGSMLLGFALAAIALSTGDGRAGTGCQILVLLAAAWPLLELATTCVRRLRRGHSVFEADGDHLHHRLARRSSHPEAVRVAHAGAGTGVLAGFVATGVFMPVAGVVASGVVGLALLGGRAERAPGTAVLAALCALLLGLAPGRGPAPDNEPAIVAAAAPLAAPGEGSPVAEHELP